MERWNERRGRRRCAFLNPCGAHPHGTWKKNTERLEFESTHSPKVVARARRLYVFLELLNLAKLGESMKGRVISKRAKIQELKAMSANFLLSNDCYTLDSKGYKMMEEVTLSLVTCLKERSPLSEDLLFIAWKWASKTVKGGASKSILWKTMRKTLEEVLVIPLNKHLLVSSKLREKLQKPKQRTGRPTSRMVQTVTLSPLCHTRKGR